jgi:hypothetical protein
MKLGVVPAGIALFFGLLALSGCHVVFGISGPDLRATVQAKVDTAVAATLTAYPTPNVAGTVKAAVEATQTAGASYTPPPPSTVILISSHGRYVTAMPDGTLRQTQELSDCGRFTLHYLDNGTVALETCQSRWVTAPTTAPDWKVTQSPSLSDCGEFVLHNQGHNRVAFETCAGRWLTAVGDSGEPAYVGYVIAQAFQVNEWEMFTMQQQP